MITERPIAPVRGTTDRLPGDHARLAGLEALLLDRFARAGYATLRTPILEPIELHERKSGAAIVAKLFELADTGGPTALRPELTAGMVLAYASATEAPPTPWRVAQVGPVFRREPKVGPRRAREFRQVGVEFLGAGGPIADGEIIWLADWALAEAGIPDATIRLGHVGLILEVLSRSGLPPAAQAALVETLGAAAAEGEGIAAVGRGLGDLSQWLDAAEADAAEADAAAAPLNGHAEGAGVDRLFRTLVPVVTGRRSRTEIVARLRRKWELGHLLPDLLERLHARIATLAALVGPADEVLDRLDRDHADLAPESVASLRALLTTLRDYGIDRSRVRLDLGFGRGIGFYSQVVFELIAETPEGPVEVCGGGRYDGLARVLGSNRDDRGIGFAFGTERLASVLDARGLGPRLREPAGVLVASTSTRVVGIATAVRALSEGRWVDGGPVVVDLGRPLDEAVHYAQRLGMASVVYFDDSDPDGRSIQQFDRVGVEWVEIIPPQTETVRELTE